MNRIWVQARGIMKILQVQSSNFKSRSKKVQTKNSKSKRKFRNSKIENETSPGSELDWKPSDSRGPLAQVLGSSLVPELLQSPSREQLSSLDSRENERHREKVTIRNLAFFCSILRDESWQP
jgi:hypothetical protein